MDFKRIYESTLLDKEYEFGYIFNNAYDAGWGDFDWEHPQDAVITGTLSDALAHAEEMFLQFSDHSNDDHDFSRWRTMDSNWYTIKKDVNEAEMIEAILSGGGIISDDLIGIQLVSKIDEDITC